jgi:HSP20 family molecular chaperone IbpA
MWLTGCMTFQCACVTQHPCVFLFAAFALVQQDVLRDMAQQFQQVSISGAKGSPQDMLRDMAQQFMQASSSGINSNPFNASSWAPPGMKSNINSGWGDGWNAGGTSSRSKRPPGNQASTRPNSSSSSQRGMLTLALDVVTTDEAYVIYADIPGEAVWPSFCTGCTCQITSSAQQILIKSAAVLVFLWACSVQEHLTTRAAVLAHNTHR